MTYITILNMENKSVDILAVDAYRQITPEEAEEIIEFRGYNSNRVQYMVTDEITTRYL